MIRVLRPLLFTRPLAAACLMVLAACGSSNKGSGDVVPDAGKHPADAYVQPQGSDASLNKDTGTPQNKDTAPSESPSPDAYQARADLVAPDTASSKDTGHEAAAIQTDTLVVDSAPSRSDTASNGDTSPRLDALAPDSVVKGDATAACNPVTPAPPLGHLTAKELKAILDSSEDVYLINVKGSSIANIPGTDAVLASDVPGIEALVGKNLCANIIIYCRSGVTSQNVGNQLVAKGYQHVRDLSDGITAWTAAGYPTE
jgi:rhodanese-related sulfurtransferase